MTQKIAIGADHAGFDEKERIKARLSELGFNVEDLGTYSDESVDYPDFAQKVGEAVASGDAAQGIVVCGSGIGISIAANKVDGVRAALAWNGETARLAREHNDANVLAIGARTTPQNEIDEILSSWLEAEFEGGRHSRRVGKITALENSEVSAAGNGA